MKQHFWSLRKDATKTLRKTIAFALFLAILMIQLKISPTTFAAAPGSVVINEVAWAGSADSSTDEWIELYNTSNQAVNLANWSINDDHGDSIYTITAGTVPAHGYFLIEDHESAVSTVTADAVIDVSLANAGDSLELFDPAGQSIDVVNSSGGAWFAGNATSKATMERVDPLVSGDIASNWKTSTGSGDTASKGSAIIGTPKKANTALQNPGGQEFNQTVDLSFSPAIPAIGDTLTVTVKTNNAQDLFAYGFDLNYDPTILHYQSAASAGFLSNNGAVSTSFQSGLENNVEGKVLLAEARTNLVKTGVNGSGNLATIQFQVVDSSPTPVNLHFGPTSFLANTLGDSTAQFNDKTFAFALNQLAAPVNLQASLGQQRYSLHLTWNAISGALKYRVYRKDTGDQWQLLQEIAATEFTDGDGVLKGGFIVPFHQYAYRVTAFDGQNEGLPAEISAQETRGLKGDNNRTDVVDGRDLEKLARHFGEDAAEASFDPLVDTTYDGQVDGNDLIDIGANFAKTYSLP